MVEHDGQVGQLLKKLDDLGITDNTIVIYTTDNGAEVMSWPDGGTTPFRGEKNTNWEGGYRVPAMVRWPGLVKPGSEINEVFSAEDWMQTLLAAVGETDLKAKLMRGATFGDKTFKVHLDGYDQRELLRNGTGSARKEFFYWTDDGGLAGLRYDKWKLAFMEQRSHGFDVWQDPMVTLRVPKLFDLRADPFERADKEGMGYGRWRIDRVFLLVPAQAFVNRFIQTLVGVPAAAEAGLVQPGGRARQADATAAGRKLGRMSVEASPAVAPGATVADMIRIPGGTFRMGSDRHYPDEAPSHTRHGRRILDRSHAGHQCAVPRLRGGDQLRDLGGDRARSQGLSRRPAEDAQGRRAGVHAARQGRRPRRLQPVVALHLRRHVAAALRQRQPHRRTGRSSRRAGGVQGRRGLRQVGRQGAADRSGMGIRRARRTGRRGVRLGRRVHAGRPAHGQHLAGQLSRTRTCAPTAGRGPRRCARSRPTATASTT